jgi:predicted ATPase
LLEAIAVGYGFNPEGGTKNYNFSTFDSHSELCDALTLSKGYKKANRGYFLRAESFYNVATAEEEYGRNILSTFTNIPTAKAFFSWRRLTSNRMGCTSWTSPKLLYLPRDS